MKKNARPVVIGRADTKISWRCATCKFLNDNALLECRMCQEKKGVLPVKQTKPTKNNNIFMTEKNKKSQV